MQDGVESVLYMQGRVMLSDMKAKKRYLAEFSLCLGMYAITVFLVMSLLITERWGRLGSQL